MGNLKPVGGAAVRGVRQRGSGEHATPYAQRALAIGRGIDALLRAQAADGSFQSRVDIGPQASAMTAIFEAWFGVLSDGDARLYEATLRAAQLPDGGFEMYPGAGCASLSATAVCRAALRAIGVPDAALVVRRAESCLAVLGGHERVLGRWHAQAEPAALFCAMAGLCEGRALLPVELSEIAVAAPLFDGRARFEWVVKICAAAAIQKERGGERAPISARSPKRAPQMLPYLLAHRGGTGAWDGSALSTMLSLVALRGAGVSSDAPEITEGLAWLAARKARTSSGVEVTLFDAEVWETSLALLALRACGVSRADDAVARGATFLETAQLRCDDPDRSSLVSARSPSGWAASASLTRPDSDHSGLALAALSHASAPRRGRASAARAVAWLRAQQSRGGGFGLHQADLPELVDGEARFASRRSLRDALTLLLRSSGPLPPELADLGDPPAADVAGRVLWGLGAAGLDAGDPIVARAISFLERDVCKDGSFMGIKNPAYVAGTAFVVVGLASVGALERSHLALRAAQWLVAAQNWDGGFGEQPGACFDATLGGHGRSTPSLTGIALRALAELAAAKIGGAAVLSAGERASQYLVETQLDDGGWSAEGYLFTLAPPMFFTWRHHRLYYPLLGLGPWHAVGEGRLGKTGTR